MNGGIPKIMIDVGHGPGYRARAQFDAGLLNEQGDTEHSIVKSYSQVVVGALIQAEYKSRSIASGLATSRLREAAKCNQDLIISLHMGVNQDAAPHKRVLWATDGSEKVARILGEALGADVVRVSEEEGLLRYNPSVQIELGNMACWEDMKQLASAEYARAIALKIAETVKTMFTTDVLPLRPRSS